MSLKHTRAAAKARGLSAKAKALLMVLADRADAKGRSFARQEVLAEDMGVSKRTVMRAFEELDASGWITRERRHRRDGTRTSDLVTVHDLETAARHVEAMLRLPLMVAIAGGRACEEPCGQEGENEGDKVTTCHLVQGDNLSPQEPITKTDESNRSLGEGFVRRNRAAEVPGHERAGTSPTVREETQADMAARLRAYAEAHERKRAG